MTASLAAGEAGGMAGWIGCALRLPPTGVPALSYAMEPVGAGVALVHAQAPVSQHASWPAAYDALVHHVCDQVVSRYSLGLAMHAALVSWRGAGILIPGVSGAGKTTLTAWLLSQGLGYLTDELILESGAESASPRPLRGWSRPLRVKSASLEQVAPWARAPGGRLLYDGGAFVEARCFGAATVAEAVPAAIVFPRRVSHAETAHVTPLSRAQAAVRLWASVVNARLLEARGMAQVTRLVRSVRAFEWVYQDVDQLHAALAQVRGEARAAVA